MKLLSYAILFLGTGVVVLQMVSVRYLFQTFNELKAMHICIGFMVLSMVAMKQALGDKKRPQLSVVVWSVVIALSLAILMYLKLNYFDLIQKGDPDSVDVVTGILLILLCIEFTRRSFGKTLVILVLVFIAYTFFGYFLPDPLRTGPFEFPYIISKYSVGFDGVLGFILGISVKYVFLFVVFGSLLLATGAHRFLFYIALTLSRYIRSGPVLSAIVPSMLMGTVTGVPSANIFVTGSFSIPLMKKVGLRPDQAGAYEVSASTGGQIMPPVMGAAAFIMADFTKSPYIKIVVLALIPALLFYLSLALYGHLTVLKLGIRVNKQDIEAIGLTGTIATAPVFIVPLAVITVIMALGYTASLAIFWGICSLVAISFLQRQTRLSCKGYLEALTEGAILGFKVSALLSVIGVIISTVILTGLGVKLSYFATGVMGHSMLGMLVVVMVACIIMGMGVPTSAAYVLVSFISAPILIDAGISLYAAHFFAFYFAVFSLVTPPVAPAAAFGAALSGGNFWRTALESSKLSVAGFLVPYLFVLFPPLLLNFSRNTLVEIVFGSLACLLIIFTLQVSFVGYYFTHCNLLHRALALVPCVLLILYLTNYAMAYFIAGAGVFLGLTGLQLKSFRRKGNPEP
jgi:TRAP transporter 4TM/12TM fusion protein